MVSPIRVAVVDDYEIVIRGVAAVLEPFADRVAVVELDSQMPVSIDAGVDIVLYDTFGQAQGNKVAVSELAHGSGVKVVVLSWNTSEELVDGAFEQGAAGYVSKGVDGEALVAALEGVHAGRRVRPPAPESPGTEADRFGRWPGDEYDLSAREAEVLALICQGLSNQEIADKAFLGMNTIKTYIRTLYRKIGVSSRTQAVLWGIARGFEPDKSRTRL